MENIVIKNEPPEVTEIRNKILNSFNELQFVEEGHKYYLRGEELQSVSHVTHQFQPITDWDKIATNYALKNGETKEYWQKQWEYNSLKATIRGTLTHEYGESIAWLRSGFPDKICASCKCKHVQNWLVPTHPKEEAILKFWDELHPSLYFVLAETKVYSGVNPNVQSLNKNYAGTFDLLFYYKDEIDDSKSGLVIMDYKGLPLDTPILTTNGWKTIGTINCGDIIFDKNGEKTKIIGTSDIHHNKCYKIIFDNGEIIADFEHRWEVSFPKSNNMFETKVMTTLEIKEYLDAMKEKGLTTYPKILMNKPLKFEKKILPIDPYVLGVWLSNGNTKNSNISNVNGLIYNEINKRGYHLNCLSKKNLQIKKQTRKIIEINDSLIKLNLIKNKHLPNEYLFCSYEQRLDLLRGLMDSNGYYNKHIKKYVYKTCEKIRKDDLIILLSSLGIKTNVTKTKISFYDKQKNKKSKIIFNITFWCDENPFLVKTIKINRPKSLRHTYRKIKSIEDVEMVETRCLEVDSPTHTFCCGYNMLVTHNTNKELVKEFSRNTNKMLLHPFESLFDESLSLYTLQLSCYQIPLEDIGLKVIGRRLIHLLEDGTYQKIPLPDVTKELRNVL